VLYLVFGHTAEEPPLRVGPMPSFKVEGVPPAGALGPFEHFSLFNGTAYASRDVFAHYNEHDHGWHVHRTDERCAAILVTPV
jgi:hypothetical protein